MGPLFAYSVLPVLSVAVLLFFTAVWRVLKEQKAL